jgi:hypothetical protein
MLASLVKVFIALFDSGFQHSLAFGFPNWHRLHLSDSQDYISQMNACLQSLSRLTDYCSCSLLYSRAADHTGNNYYNSSFPFACLSVAATT